MKWNLKRSTPLQKFSTKEALQRRSCFLKFELLLTLLALASISAIEGNLTHAATNPRSLAPAAYWTNTGSLNTPRFFNAATLLPDGQVLVVGGDSAELYNPATGTWTYTSSPQNALGTATLLPDGRVLSVGGTSAQLYDPISHTWSVTGSLNEPKSGGIYSRPTAVLLQNGKVLMIGRQSAEIYNPASGTWAITGRPQTDGTTATLLQDGRVLLVATQGRAEVYDPVSEQWSMTGSLNPNTDHTYEPTLTLLPSGKVLAVGGQAAVAPTGGELYDPVSGTWTGAFIGGGPVRRQFGHTATLLKNGGVLVVGGIGSSGPVNSASFYNPRSKIWSGAGSVDRISYFHTATSLPNGQVLVAGGSDGTQQSPLTNAALYTAYTISGRISTGSSGLGGVTMTLSGDSTASTTSDADGGYWFPNLQPLGNYTVTPSRVNYNFTPQNLAFTNLNADQTSANFTATLLTFTISGRVSDSSGGLSGVTMTLSGGQSATVATDANGNYSFPSLPAEHDYTITPSKLNYVFTPAQLTFNNLSAHQSAANFSAELARYAISGRVLDGVNALSGTTISLSGSQNATTTTNASGNYSFTNLQATGNYTITPSKAHYSFTPSQQSFSNLSDNRIADFTASLLTYSISGRVSVGANGLSGVTMSLMGGQSTSTTTDANGNYSFSGVQATGNYTVTPSKSGFIFSPSSRTFTNLIADNLSADFVGTPLYKISGHIKTITDTPLSDVIVQLSGTTVSTAVTDANGDFSFEILQGSNCIVTPARTDYTFTPALRTFVNLSAAQTANFTAVPIPTLQLLLEEGTFNRVAALDSVLFLRDHFLLINPINLLNPLADKNTRLLVFVTNLELQQGDVSSSVMINAVDSNNTSYVVFADDVRPVPNFAFKQVAFRLPDNLPSGELTITLTYGGQSSNSGVIRIQ